MGLFDEYIPINKFDYITKIPAFIQAVGAYVLGLAAADHTHAEGDGTTIITRTNSPVATGSKYLNLNPDTDALELIDTDGSSLGPISTNVQRAVFVDRLLSTQSDIALTVPGLIGNIVEIGALIDSGTSASITVKNGGSTVGTLTATPAGDYETSLSNAAVTPLFQDHI